MNSTDGDNGQPDLGKDQDECITEGSPHGRSRTSSKHRKRSLSFDDDEDHHKKSVHRSTKSRHRSHRHKSKKRRRYEDDRSSEGYSGSSSSSFSEDSCSDWHKKKRHRDEKKHSKKKKDRSKNDKKKKKRERGKNCERLKDISSTPTFGQYGILKASDMSKAQRSFEVWLSEIHGVHLSSSNVPKYELQQYFDTYREDFNTATLPHVKYYNYDKWELDEHNRLRQNEALKDNSASSAVLEDERNHANKLKLLARQKEQTAIQLVAASMNSSKIADMQQQKQLQAQMQVAFKTGDLETYRKLKEKLQPLDK